MRKSIVKLLFAGLLGFSLFSLKPVKARAEEEIIVEEQEEEQTFDEFKEEVETYLEQYADTSLVAKIISWAVDAGVLTALFTISLKYGKYKHTTTGDLIKMFKDQIGEYIETNFKELSKSEILKITDKVGDIEKSLETIMKVLVLMQDSSAKGKVALIDFLTAKTSSEELTKTSEEVIEKIESKEKIVKEVNEKVKGEYENIF